MQKKTTYEPHMCWWDRCTTTLIDWTPNGYKGITKTALAILVFCVGFVLPLYLFMQLMSFFFDGSGGGGGGNYTPCFIGRAEC